MKMDNPDPAIDDCWNRIGVWSKEGQSCERLEDAVHCQNCTMYSDAGRRLLDRPAPHHYLQEWTKNLGAEKEDLAQAKVAAIVFRVGNEWFALQTLLLKEVTELRSIHSIPHSASRVLKGIVNIRGELLLCVSLGYLFGLEKAETSRGKKHSTIHERLIVAECDGDAYALPVSEVLGIRHYDPEQLQKVPSTIANAEGTFLTGIFEESGKCVGCLDAELLFHALKRRLV
jgi:chemotaxis-related protein WspD